MEFSNSKKRVAVLVGLQSVISNPEVNYGVVSQHSILVRQVPPKSINHSCFLQACQLCGKSFDHTKDIYMYRGDQGFCSMQCRSRQITMDELDEIEASMKRKQKSYRYRASEGCRETKSLLEDLRRTNRRQIRALVKTSIS